MRSGQYLLDRVSETYQSGHAMVTGYVELSKMQETRCHKSDSLSVLPATHFLANP